MATEIRCPVCAEGFTERPARCFRCETVLGSWWRFEDELRGLAPGPRASPARGAFALATGLGLAALALAIALLGRSRAAPDRPRPAPPPAAASVGVLSRPSPSVRYTVQPGDSPWRIAAALTGQGRRWRELWPGLPPKLVPGMVLDLPVGADPR